MPSCFTATGSHRVRWRVLGRGDALELADYHDHALPLADRARSYLHANCAHCHRKWGGGNALFELVYSMPLAETKMLGIAPQHGDFGISDPARCPVTGLPDDCDVFFFDVIEGGNPNLRPETSTQWNAGIVWEPARGLTLGIDYWNIEKKDVINIYTGSG